MKSILEIQTRLRALGLYKGLLDGKQSKGGPTEKAIMAFQSANGLQADGIAGARTQAVLFPPVVTTVSTLFDKQSVINLGKAHPSLQKVMNEARKHVEFRVLDATRGEAAQTKAYNEKASKAKFGQSAHNYTPAIAVDIFPAPYNWKDRASFEKAAEIIMRVAREMKVPLRWGGDWNMDGNKTTSDSWDMPHFELHPWRDYAKGAQLVRP